MSAGRRARLPLPPADVRICICARPTCRHARSVCWRCVRCAVRDSLAGVCSWGHGRLRGRRLAATGPCPPCRTLLPNQQPPPQPQPPISAMRTPPVPPFSLLPSPFSLRPSPFALHPSPFTLHSSAAKSQERSVESMYLARARVSRAHRVAVQSWTFSRDRDMAGGGVEALRPRLACWLDSRSS